MKASVRLIATASFLVIAAVMSACGSSAPATQPGATTTPQISGTQSTTGQPTGGGEWCKPAVYSQTQTGQGVVEGLVEFRGGTYCKTTSTVSSSGVTVIYSYYYNEDSSDTWAVMNSNGTLIETHTVNGEVVYQSEPITAPAE